MTTRTEMIKSLNSNNIHPECSRRAEGKSHSLNKAKDTVHTQISLQ